MLVVGTEHSSVLFMDPGGQAVKLEVKVPSQPVQLICEGQYDVEYKVFVMCRNGTVCQIRQGECNELQI
jgi:hypothetical protein